MRLVVIFRAHSDVEASVVRGLLETHDIPSVASSEVSRSLFPLTVTTLSVSVNEEDAADARRIIESHRTELPGGRVVRLRDGHIEIANRPGVGIEWDERAIDRYRI